LFSARRVKSKVRERVSAQRRRNSIGEYAKCFSRTGSDRHGGGKKKTLSSRRKETQ